MVLRIEWLYTHDGLECEALNPDTNDQIGFHGSLDDKVVMSVHIDCQLTLVASVPYPRTDTVQTVRRHPTTRSDLLHAIGCLPMGSEDLVQV